MHLHHPRGLYVKKQYKLPIFGEVTVASMIGTAVGIVISSAWYFTKYWILNNVLAVFLALAFLKTLRLSKLAPGMLLLGLLFFYDIFWVFLSPYFTKGGKSVMVAVATGLDIPIKLVMPHLTSDFPSTNCSILGLGDILIPGIFIIFMARFGFEMVNTQAYFKGAMTAYSLSLLACYGSLWIFKAAQPALLYIVPGLFVAVIYLGKSRGEWQMLKDGIISNNPISYQNQALNEESDDPFRSTIKEIERGRNLGGASGQFELTRLSTGSKASTSINRV
ncbi:hypothetical protein FGO68_gene7152 [Halteria grandinella]|uniref:Uncharacterized protein n=1 Tax=Halteria grandinella TaxID=5974 RepID=A0A8J8T379_HALGN|nr:hypothetical protein FGO68_gene7152 [Halteria grandinella]